MRIKEDERDDVYLLEGLSEQDQQQLMEILAQAWWRPTERDVWCRRSYRESVHKCYFRTPLKCTRCEQIGKHHYHCPAQAQDLSRKRSESMELQMLGEGIQ